MSEIRSVVLQGEVTIGQCAEVLEQLREVVASDGPARVQASEVTRIDTAGVQLLAAFARDVADSGRRVEWDEVADCVVQAAQLLGLDAHLSLPEAPPAQEA